MESVNLRDSVPRRRREDIGNAPGIRWAIVPPPVAVDDGAAEVLVRYGDDWVVALDYAARSRLGLGLGR